MMDVDDVVVPGDGGGDPRLGPSSMIVLFVKHVHLQNVGAAIWRSSRVSSRDNSIEDLPLRNDRWGLCERHLQAADIRDTNVAINATTRCIRAIAAAATIDVLRDADVER
jgi:hypothetical protein